jgi:4-amino-4-deoxy-L-arabinose transferase-like glycosyltransferase
MLARINSGLAELEVNARTQYVALGLITMLAALLRFYKLGEWSFWIDEIYTIGRAQAHYSSLEATVHNIPPSRNWVPVSVILTAGTLNALGTSEWSARLVSAVIGVLSIPVLYLLVKRLFSPGVGLIAALLLAVSPWHIYGSQNARFYTSLILLYSLALFALFQGLERDRPGYLLISMALLYLAASERVLALFMVPVVVCYLLLLWLLRLDRPVGLRARNLGLVILPVIAAGIVEIHSLLSSGISRFFGDFYWFFQFHIDDPLRLLSFISFDVGVPLMSFSILCGVFLIVKKSRAGLLLFVNAVVPVVVLLALNPFMFTKSRYAFITLPSWIALGAAGIRELLRETKELGRILALGLLLMLLADSGGSNLLYYQINNGNRHDWKGAFSLIHEQREADDELATSWPEWEGFYWDKEIIVWEDLDPEFVVSSGKRFWFILNEEIVWGNATMKRWLETNAELIEVLYLRRPDNNYLRIHLYDPAAKTR